MSITKTTLVYFSPTGTTKAVLTAIAKGIGLPVSHLDLTLPAARNKQYAFSNNELVLIGFPVYGGRVPQIQESIFPLLEPAASSNVQSGADLAVPSVKVVPVVVYGNREYDDALLELTHLCQKKNYMPVSAAAFIGEHSYAPELGHKRPDGKDKELAKSFGDNLIKNLAKHLANNITNSQPQNEVDKFGKPDKFFDPAGIPGNMPYKERGPKLPTAPETDENCIDCLICVKRCPTEAISLANPADINQERCILCAACVKKCPTGAKHITFEPLLQRMAAISAANTTPKQPALFLPE